MRAENAGPGGCVPWEEHQARVAELEAELKQANERASDADTDWHACMDCLSEAKAEVEKLREDKEEIAAHGLYWTKRTEKAEAEVEKLRSLALTVEQQAQVQLREAEADRDRLDLEARDLRIEVDLMTGDRDRLAEALRGAVADLEWVDMKHDYKFSVAARAALEGKAE